MTTATPDELMTVAASRLLTDDAVVFAGIGVPLIAAALAKRRQAPNLTIVLEGGIVGTELRPGRLPSSTNEVRAADGAEMLTDSTDIFLLAQRGFFDFGFLGVAQIDAYGNINTSVIGDVDRPKVRLPGSGGANDIISLCNQTLVVTDHEPRRFVERVDFVTSVGYGSGRGDRERLGLTGAGPKKIITDLGVLEPDPETLEFTMTGLYPGVSASAAKELTGWDLTIAANPETIAAPTPTELNALRRFQGTQARSHQ